MAAPSVGDLIRKSAASHEFKAAVRALDAGDLNHAARRIQFGPGDPPTRVLYTILRVLETHPELPIESARLEAFSQHSSYTGQIIVEPNSVRFQFTWDPEWKATQLGWKTARGAPDYNRAARERGPHCFRYFARAL